MLNIINTILATASLAIAILDYIKNSYTGSIKYIHKTQFVCKKTIIVGVQNNQADSSKIDEPKKDSLHSSLIIYSFTGLCIFCMIYFSVKPIASTIALFCILATVVFTHFRIFNSLTNFGIPLRHYILYIASIVSVGAILIFFSSSGDLIAFFSYELKKAYLYFVMAVSLIAFAFQSAWLIRTAEGFLVDDERFIVVSEILILQCLITTGIFEIFINAIIAVLSTLIERFFTL